MYVYWGEGGIIKNHDTASKFKIKKDVQYSLYEDRVLIKTTNN